MIYTSYINLGERLAPLMGLIAPVLSVISVISRVSPRLGDAIRERAILITLGFLGSPARKSKMSTKEALTRMARMVKELGDIDARRAERASA